jgi:hypothetical protein
MISTLVLAGLTAAVLAWIALRRSFEKSVGKRRKYGASELYYTAKVSEAEAGRLGGFLAGLNFFGYLKTVQLTRDGDTYQVRMVVNVGDEQDEETVARCDVIAAELAGDVFDGAPVEVHLCDDLLRTVRVVPHRERFGRRIRFNAAELFYTAGVTEGEARRLGQYLMDADFFNANPKLAQLNRVGDRYELRLNVKRGTELAPELIETFQRMANDLSEEVFDRSTVSVDLCDSVIGTMRWRAPSSEGSASPDR